jgi:hypothetical protein
MTDSVSSSTSGPGTSGVGDVGKSADVGAAQGDLSANDAADVASAVSKETPDVEAASLDAADSFDAPAAAEDAAPADDAAAPAAVDPAAMANFDAVSQTMQSLSWTESPQAAVDAAASVRSAVAGLPAEDQQAALQELMGPVNDMAKNGLKDPVTGAWSTDRVAAVGAFSDLLGQPGVDGLATNLRSAAEDGAIPARDAIANTLQDVATTNQDIDVQRSAAKSLMNGPADVMRDALAGKIDGFTPEGLANLSRTRGDVFTDQRMLGLSDQLDPSVRGRLEAQGLRTEALPSGSDFVHDALDVAGLVPGFGEPADALNAALYAAEGKLFDAGISAAAVLTGIGSAGTLSRLGGKAFDEAADLGTAARTLGQAREEAAAAAFQAKGFDAQVANIVTHNTDIDVVLNTPQGRYAMLVGGDAKAMTKGQLDEAKIQETLDRFRRAEEAALDVDGPFRADGVGALMAFPRDTTDPRVIDRFIQELGARSVMVF